MKKCWICTAVLLLICMALTMVAVPVNAAENCIFFKAEPRYKTGKLFTMEVGTVSSMITTVNSPGKYIVDYELDPNGTLSMFGVVYHNLSGDNIYTGAGALDMDYVQEACLSCTTSSGQTIRDSTSVSSLTDGLTYRGFAINQGGGKMSNGYIDYSCD